MRIEVRLFAGVREALGRETLFVEAATPLTVGDLKRLLAESYPELTPWLSKSRLAIDNRFANDQHDLTGREEMALIPPVSGG